MNRPLAAALALAATPALAHHPLGGAPMTTLADGLLSGVGHPILGFDHLFFVALAGVAGMLAGRRVAGPAAYVAAMLAGCAAADVLVLHSPPKGVADVTSAGQSVGSTAIRAAIARIAPRLAVCGHIHDSWGEEGTIGPTRVVNLGPEPNWFDIGDTP